MRLRFFGHACLRVDHGSSSILMDPWFSSEGAFFRSWHQFPDNSEHRSTALDGVNGICLSHDHEDHLDPSVIIPILEGSSDVILHVAKFQSDWFIRRVRAVLPGLEDRIVEHAAFEPFNLESDLQLFFVPEDSPAQVDSAIVCRSNGKSLVNLNDARLNTDQLLEIKRTLGKVDYLTLQGSGASEYPVCYQYDNDDMEKRSLDKRHAKILACENVIDLLEVNRVLIFAGPPAFLDPDIMHLSRSSDTSVFPDQMEVLRDIESRRSDITDKSLFLLPGEDFDEENLWSNIDFTDSKYFPYTNREKYITDYAKVRSRQFGLGGSVDQNELLNHLNYVAQVSSFMAEKIGGIIVFDVISEDVNVAVSVDFDNKLAYLGEDSEATYRIQVPASLASKVLRGSATWDEVFLSFRTKIEERGEYLPHLKLLLKYLDHDVFDLLESFEGDLSASNEDIEMIDICSQGRKLQIQRFCPHAKTDLSRQSIINPDGTLTCLAHRLTFDLNTGYCINAKGYRIRVEHVDTFTQGS